MRGRVLVKELQRRGVADRATRDQLFQVCRGLFRRHRRRVQLQGSPERYRVRRRLGNSEPARASNSPRRTYHYVCAQRAGGGRTPFGRDRASNGALPAYHATRIFHLITEQGEHTCVSLIALVGPHSRPPRCRSQRSPRVTARLRSSPSIRRSTVRTSTCFAATRPGREGVRHAHRELLAAAGFVRRSELLHAGSGRRLRHPPRQRRRCDGRPDVPLPF